MPICRLCRTREADSAEHLFQSAIGGTLEVPGVLCKPCNDRMGTTIDADLAKALSWFRVMLAIEGDRGQTATIRAVDTNGRDIILGPGLLPQFAETRPSVVQLDDDRMNMVAHSARQARQLVEAYQRKRPDQVLTVDEVKVRKSFPASIKVDVSFRGEDFFRPAVKTALVLLSHLGLETGDALANAWRYVNGDRAEECDVRVFWSAEPAPWRDDSLGPVPHRVSVRSDVANRAVLADVRYFGDFAFCIRMGAELSTSFRVGYGVDALTGTDVVSRDWTGNVGDPGRPDSNAIYDAVERAFGQIARAAEPIGRRLLAKRIVESCTKKVLGGRRDGPVSKAEHDAIAACVREELTLMAVRQNAEEAAPELMQSLQDAANKKRPA